MVGITSPEPLRYPYPPPVLLPAKCFAAYAAQCQGLPSNALDYQSPSTPYSPSVGTDRTGLRVTLLVTTSAIFAFRFVWGATPWLIGDSQSPYAQQVTTRRITGIPSHPLTAIPTSSVGRLAPVQDSKGCFKVIVLSAPVFFSRDLALYSVISCKIS